MAKVDIHNIDEFINLMNKYNFKSLDEMFNNFLPFMKWALASDLKIGFDKEEGEINDI